MGLDEVILRILQYAKAEILPVIPEDDRKMVTAVGITNALRIRQAWQNLLPVAKSIRMSDEDVDKLMQFIKEGI